MTLTREDIVAAIAARKSETTTVAVPEWGGDVRVRRLSAGEFERSGVEARERGSMVRVIAACIVDDNGERLFTEAQASALADTDIETMARVFAAAMKFSGLVDSETVDELMSAFDSAQPDGSSSD